MHTTAKKHIKEKGKNEKSLFVLLLNVLREEGEREGKGKKSYTYTTPISMLHTYYI